MICHHAQDLLQSAIDAARSKCASRKVRDCPRITMPMNGIRCQLPAYSKVPLPMFCLELLFRQLTRLCFLLEDGRQVQGCTIRVAPGIRPAAGRGCPLWDSSFLGMPPFSFGENSWLRVWQQLRMAPGSWLPFLGQPSRASARYEIYGFRNPDLNGIYQRSRAAPSPEKATGPKSGTLDINVLRFAKYGPVQMFFGVAGRKS